MEQKGAGMAIFGRKKDDNPSGEPAPDASLAMPMPRPLPPSGTALQPFNSNKDSQMSQPLKPATPPAPNSLAQRPGGPGGPGGVGVPARPTQAPNPGGDRRTLTVGKGISLQGTVADCERLVVEGTVESQMLQAAELSITATGVFRGEVQVEDAEVAGLFDGTLTARGNLIIRATGKVNGVARCKRLSVEDGGQLTGRMEMLTEGGVAPAPSAPSAPVAPARPATVG